MNPKHESWKKIDVCLRHFTSKEEEEEEGKEGEEEKEEEEEEEEEEVEDEYLRGFRMEEARWIRLIARRKANIKILRQSIKALRGSQPKLSDMSACEEDEDVVEVSCSE